MKWVKRVILIAFFLPTGLVVWLLFLAWTRIPILEGEFVHPSLNAEVIVKRDTWGVPHIDAQSETDAYFALGYVMGQDRLFQMELLRRVANGQIAEVLGSKLVPLDALVRSFQLRPKAVETDAMLRADFPEIYTNFEAFTSGINFRMENEALPVEFAVLGMSARPFQFVDCLSIGALLPITFADGLREDPLFTLLQEKLPNHDISELFPGYSNDTPITIMETLEEARTYLATASAPEARYESPQQTVDGLGALLALLNPISEKMGPSLGSNSWVLGPSRTTSGKAILANDPHIGFTNPSIWYEAQVRFPGHELYGYYMPLVPVPLLGQNRHHAWALTMFKNDDVDMFRETFKEDDPALVRFKEEWTPVTNSEDVIKVRWGKDVPIKLRRTPHGPVVTDVLHALLDYEGPDVALSWVWQNVDYTDMIAFYKMGRATSYEEFEEGIALVTSPGVNISYADAADNIAWWAAGKIPIRPSHVNNKALLDGASGKDEMLGFVSFSENPHLKNPSAGVIVTANNKSTVKSVGEVQDLAGYWQPWDRAGRIEEMLDAKEIWPLDELKVLQLDTHAFAAPKIVATIATSLVNDDIDYSDLEKDAQTILATWDFKHDIDSPGAALYQVLCTMIMREALHDEMGETYLTTYGSLSDHWNFFKSFIQNPTSAYWDNISTETIESRDNILQLSFRAAVDHLEKIQGVDPKKWSWGQLHQLTFAHPFGYLPGLGSIFNVGPFPVSGGAQIVNNMLYNPSALNFDVIAGPSARRLIDFADPDNPYGILPTGNSGNFQSPHYDDQTNMFIKGDYRTVYCTSETVDANLESTLILKP